jgi:hypothetical protein
VFCRPFLTATFLTANFLTANRGYQQHRVPPLQKAQGWGTRISVVEKTKESVAKAGTPPVGSWLRRTLVEAEGYFYVDHGGYGLVVFFAGFEAPGFYGFDGFFVQA